MFLAFYFDHHSSDGRIHVRNKLLAVCQPISTTGEGLYQCFKRALAFVQLDDWKKKLISFGYDGASANIAAGGLKRYLEKDVPWILMFWCLAHRLELALKDALKNNPTFLAVDEMLLKLYFLYEKSPKKCRELKDVLEEMIDFADENEFSNSGGHKPLRACGTRFIAHKVSAMHRVVEKYGAYVAHIISLAGYRSVKAMDKQRLIGYARKWNNGKLLLGCAMMHDLLEPYAKLCKALQEEEVCVISAVKALLDTANSINSLKSVDFHNLPTVKMVLSRIKAGDKEVTYQGAVISRLAEANQVLARSKNAYAESISMCLKNRVNDENLTVLNAIITLLATHRWEKTSEVTFGDSAVETLADHFKDALVFAGFDHVLLLSEWHSMLTYAKQYLNLAVEDYRKTWWKIFNCAKSGKWKNILLIVELVFSLPFSNGAVERVFSRINAIKPDQRCRLSEDRLHELVCISIDGLPLKQWDASLAIKLWWNDKLRRPQSESESQGVVTDAPEFSSERETAGSTFDLGDWDEFFGY